MSPSVRSNSTEGEAEAINRRGFVSLIIILSLLSSFQLLSRRIVCCALYLYSVSIPFIQISVVCCASIISLVLSMLRYIAIFV